MPFLIPAIVALSSDTLVLYLSHLRGENSVNDDDEEEHMVYNVDYLMPLALIRMGLLCLPLFCHSYTGTALKCASFYRLLYWGTFFVLLIHMLSLSLMNPESLESLLPYDGSVLVNRRMLLKHLHELRRIWWMLIASFVSDICHLIILRHVRSTAPEYELMFGRRHPSVYYAIRSANMGDVIGDSFSQHDEPALMHAMNEFFVDLQARLHRAKAEWGSRLDDFAHRSHNERSMRIGSLQNPLVPMTSFRILLQLFAYEDVLANGKLDAVFDMDEGESMTFYVPQLLSFLLHGALYCSPQLEEWILDKCQRNVHFAHRCYWFLRAWCLEVPVELPRTPILSRTSSEVNIQSTDHRGLTPFLDQPASPIPTKSVECGLRQSLSQGSLAFRSADKFLPEERYMIERLMLRVKESGEYPAIILEYGVGEPDGSTNVISDEVRGSATAEQTELSEFGEDYSPSTLMAATEPGCIPIHPHTGRPSVKHLDSVSATRRFGLLPLTAALSGRSQSAAARSTGHNETEHFDKTPQFLDALIFLAESLFIVPREKRKEELQTQLRLLECELLPSNAVYLPIGNVNHSVWRFVAEESIVINTKERVPCIVCMEVVEHAARRKHSKAWAFLDRLPGMHQRDASSEFTTEMLPPAGSLVRQMSAGSDHGSHGHLSHTEKSEFEMVNEWRFSNRDPLRRVSLLDKMTTTVRDTVKVPLDKMKTQVRDQLNQFRDRSISEELRNLTLAEVLIDEDRQQLPDVVEATESMSSDIESGIQRSQSDIQEDIPNRIRSLSRVSSAGSIASMGQWSSPQPAAINVSSHVGKNGKESLTGIRRRIDKEDDEIGASTRSLRYGSDHEEEHDIGDPSPSKTRRSSGTKDSSAKGVAAKRPQVVFRESWQAKQERIRKQSAYGSHPGWRLLPVLIKANDDLRQEQLASQLIYRMALILAREKVPVWLCPYEIIALTDSGGIIEAIPDTISLDSLKRNDPSFTNLRDFFHSHFGEGTEELADAKANFIESLAAYSIVCFLLQIKDRHNGNILLDNRGHVIHIDFGFFFLSSPGSNVGFESAPFKLTRDFVQLMDGPHSRLFKTFRELCIKCFITLRRHCMEIILLVEMLKNGNEELKCFRGRPDDAIQQLRERFRLDLNDRACREYVNSLVDDSIENWRTAFYDKYQRYMVGVL